MLWRRYLLPLILMIFSIVMMLGSSEERQGKAAWFGRTLLFPLSHSLRWVQTNSGLRAQINDLQVKVVDYNLKNLELQNRLRMYYFTEEVKLEGDYTDFEIAEVIGYAGQFHERSLIVSKGKKSGIKPDDAVISALGIIGKVVQVSDTYAIVLPYSNPQFQLPVMTLSSSVQGILQAGISGKVLMNLIRLGSEIAVGDTIVASNLSRLFPKGYPIGRISRIKESQDNLFISAELSPFTLVENLEYVFIIKKRQENE